MNRSGRDAILGNIAKRRGGVQGAGATDSHPAPGRRDPATSSRYPDALDPDRLADPPTGPQPAFDGSPEDAFLRRLEEAAGSHARADGPREAVAAITNYLHERRLPARVPASADPLLDALPWPPGFVLERRLPGGNEPVALGLAAAAVAETGSLVLFSGPTNPTSMNFLPDIFLCLLPRDRIVPYMEDAWDLLRARNEGLPRAVNLITGPSRTADVEQTIQMGAHGPRHVHVVLMGPSA